MKTRRRSWSLARRLVAALLGIVFLAAAIQIATIYHALLRESAEVFDYQLRQTAQVLIAAAPAGSIAPVAASPDSADNLDLLVREKGADGTVHGNAIGVLPDHLPAGYADIATRMGPVRAYTVMIGHREVSVGQRLDARHDLANEVAWATLWPTAFLAIASLALLFAVLRATLQPITRLREQVLRRASSSLAPLDDPGLPRELGPLLQATNDLVAQLNSAVEQQRRFLADAAHELRTPIAAISLQNTLVAKADSDDERRASLRAQEAGIRRASRLIDQLLDLSRLETIHAPTRKIEFDLVNELRALVDLHAHETAAKRTMLILPGHPIKILGDPALASAVFGNLIANAIRHCPTGSRVAIAETTIAGNRAVRVSDDGPGIPSALRSRMLQPFSRGEDATTPGTGLGLAIVMAACQRAGWRLQFDDAPQGGLAATVVLAATRP